MDCSVVITACNEMPHLVYTIQSCLEQLENYNSEIIVVDNKSTDNTKKYIESQKNQKVKYFPYHNKYSHWNAKSIGINKSKGKYIFMIDAHCLLSEQALPKLLSFAENYEGKLGAVHCMHSYMLADVMYQHYCMPKFIHRFMRAQTYEVHNKPYKVPCMTTCGMLSPKKVFDDIGVWHKEFGMRWGGETYMNFKQGTCGYDIIIHDKAHYHHFKHIHPKKMKYSDGCRNQMIASYVTGGEEWLNRVLSSYLTKKKLTIETAPEKNNFVVMANDVKNKCKDEREIIEKKQVISLTDYFKRWNVK